MAKSNLNVNSGRLTQSPENITLRQKFNLNSFSQVEQFVRRGKSKKKEENFRIDENLLNYKASSSQQQQEEDLNTSENSGFLEKLLLEEEEDGMEDEDEEEMTRIKSRDEGTKRPCNRCLLKSYPFQVSKQLC